MMRHTAFRLMAVLSVLCFVVHWSANRFYWNGVEDGVKIFREDSLFVREDVDQLLHRLRSDSTTSAAAMNSLRKPTPVLSVKSRLQNGLEGVDGDDGLVVAVQHALAESVPTRTRSGRVLLPGVPPSRTALRMLRPPEKIAASSTDLNDSLQMTAKPMEWRGTRSMTTQGPLPKLDPLGRFITGYFGIGRLGNNLFVYASTLGVALRHGLRVVYCLNDVQLAWYTWMRTAFQLSAIAGTCNFDPDAYIEELGWGRYTPAVDSPAKFRRRTYLLFYMQSYKYFEAYRPQVLREFALTPAYARHADGVLRRAAAGRPNVTFVGVHVRRGDMVDHRLYRVAPESYLVRAVQALRERLRASSAKLVFVVASDDATWTAAALRRLGLLDDATVMSTSAELDLAVLSRCNHSIITSGSYGWWAAWLAGGDVIYYRGFMPNTSELASGYEPSDYYPPSWLGLD